MNYCMKLFDKYGTGSLQYGGTFSQEVPVKITLKARLTTEGDVIETESSTLGELLSELSKKYPDSRFFNRQRREVNFEYFVELNGQLLEQLPDELDRRLNDSDTLEIYQCIEYEDD